MADLITFAKTAPTRRTACWLCSVPEAAEINAAKRERTATVTQMVAWMIHEQGYSEDEARVARFSNHFQAKHHERWPDGRTG